MQEIQLIEKFKSGDGEAFRRLMNNYRTKLFSYLWRFSDTRETTEELFQETMIKVWKGIKKYNEHQKFSAWLFTIAHNTAMDDLRKRKNENNFTTLDEVNYNQSSNNPDDEIIVKETLEIINNSINILSQKQKTVFLLRQHGNLTFKEIAETTKESINTVISHMHYAVKKIKNQIEKENEPRRKTVVSKI